MDLEFEYQSVYLLRYHTLFIDAAIMEVKAELFSAPTVAGAAVAGGEIRRQIMGREEI
jgi:hypothetical protein